VSFLLKGEDTGGKLMLMELTEWEGGGPPRHVHHREDEILYVLEGEIAVEVDGETHEARAGTLALLPRGLEHVFAVESERAKLLVMAMPAGLEGYFEEMSRPAESLEQPSEPEETSESEKLARIAAKYGIEVTGLPLSHKRETAPGKEALGDHRPRPLRDQD